MTDPVESCPVMLSHGMHMYEEGVSKRRNWIIDHERLQFLNQRPG